MNERIKRLRANIAEQIVQKQSVHLRCFSSTGKFLNVYALFLNILNQDPNNFYLFKFYPKYFFSLPTSTSSPCPSIPPYNNFNYIDE